MSDCYVPRTTDYRTAIEEGPSPNAVTGDHVEVWVAWERQTGWTARGPIPRDNAWTVHGPLPRDGVLGGWFTYVAHHNGLDSGLLCKTKYSTRLPHDVEAAIQFLLQHGIAPNQRFRVRFARPSYTRDYWTGEREAIFKEPEVLETEHWSADQVAFEWCCFLAEWAPTDATAWKPSQFSERLFERELCRGTPL